jgi:hypothetical protein
MNGVTQCGDGRAFMKLTSRNQPANRIGRAIDCRPFEALAGASDGRAFLFDLDIDLFEVNEAFAAVVLRYLQAFDLDPSKVNVNGGAIALGHPLGATGAMILGTALDELERTGKSTALITLCIGAGMGTATIIERV